MERYFVWKRKGLGSGTQVCLRSKIAIQQELNKGEADKYIKAGWELFELVPAKIVEETVAITKKVLV